MFLWPWLAVLLERRLYDARNPSTSRGWRFWSKRQHAEETGANAIPPEAAISIRHLGKEFDGKGGHVTAISDLSLDIPKSGIYVLLGSNGCVYSLVHLSSMFMYHLSEPANQPPCQS